MTREMLSALSINAALLFGLTSLYIAINFRHTKRRWIGQVLFGILIGCFAVVLMLNPWRDPETPALIYDTRSVLISITGAFFGIIPTAIAAILAIIYRISVGGSGVYAGSLSILLPAILGILWHKFPPIRIKMPYLVQYWFFGIFSTAFMLVAQLAIIPWPYGVHQIITIGPMVMIFFPAMTALLAVIIRKQFIQLNAQKEIKQSEQLLKAGINSPIKTTILAIDTNYRYLFFNEFHRNYMSDTYGVKIAKGMNVLEAIRIKLDRDTAKTNYDRVFSGDSFVLTQSFGETIKSWFESNYSPIRDEFGKTIGLIAVAQDTTEKYNLEAAIRNSEAKNSLLVNKMIQGLAVHEIILNENGDPVDYRFIDVNESFERITGLKREDILGKTVLEVLPGTEQDWIEKYGYVSLTGEPMQFQSYSKELGKYFELSAFSPQPKQFAVIITDITERKQNDAAILFLNYHDPLTGLYNRRYYEQAFNEMQKAEHMPISAVMADINGLKIVNDAFGHSAGDQLLLIVTQIFNRHCREEDVVARIGGDEFVILMPKTPYSEALKVIDAITSDMDKTTLLGVNVSVSLGLACQKVESSNIDIIKEAEIDMYNKKLFEISSKRSETIKTILATLHLKNPREESHSRRVSELCQSIGEILQMRKDQLNLLRTMGNLHDIGKIAIDEVILNKAGKLTDDEWSKVKRHPEIGYRILATAVEYADIAEDILAHHERWDGKGYPKGLKGEEIPLRARIIAIADAYDAMTSSRPYRPALTEDYASAEIIKNAGIQFDPDIAFKFVTEYLHRDWSNNKTIT